MPTPCYISITGQTQGNITAGAFTADSVGNIYVQGHEDEMLVQEFLHNVTVPTDPQSGQPAGQRAHKPFIFTVALNKAVPLMYNALASGEMLPTTEPSFGKLHPQSACCLYTLLFLLSQDNFLSRLFLIVLHILVRVNLFCLFITSQFSFLSIIHYFRHYFLYETTINIQCIMYAPSTYLLVRFIYLES